MQRLSMDGLATIVAALMGTDSYQKAAKRWGVNHMTLYNIVNPEPGKEIRPPRREDLLKIAEGDPDVYMKLALAAYGILQEAPAPAPQLTRQLSPA